MPVQKGQSLLALLGDKGRKAHESHRADETTYGIINLPSGITGGVAQLVTARLDKYKPGTKWEGRPYVLLRGIAKTPPEHKGVPVEGQGVMITIPLCDTPERKNQAGGPKLFADNYAEFLNELRRLGAEPANMPYEAVEPTLQALEQTKPHYRFSTRGWIPPKTPQNPNPSEMVFTQFDGICEWNGEASPGDAVQDSSVQVEEPAADVSSEEQSQEADEFGDLDSLAKAADSGDADAAQSLKDQAIGLGISEEDVDSADNWAAVVVMMNSQGGEPEKEAEPEPPKEPKVKQVWFYKPPQMRKAVECEVTAVDKKSKTVNLLNLDNRKLSYKGIKWTDISST